MLTDKSTAITGRVSDSRGVAVTDASVVVVPADAARWTYQSRFIRAVRPDQDGRFEIRGLPASDRYLAIALQGLEDGQAGDPELLERLAIRRRHSRSPTAWRAPSICAGVRQK